MLNALLIADQQRLHALVASALGEHGVRLTITGDLASGIEQAAADPPALLFVQGRISGLSVEIVSRHVATRLDREQTSSFIFINPSEDPDSVTTGQICLDLALPDSLLETRIASLVQSLHPAGPDICATGSASTAARDPVVPHELPSEPATPLPEAEEAAELPPPAGPSTVSPVATRFEAELDTELARRSGGRGADEPPAQIAPVQASGNDQPRVGQAEAVELVARSRRRLMIISGAVLLLVAGVAGIAFLLQGSSTTAPQSRPVPATQQATIAPRPAGNAQSATTVPSAPASATPPSSSPEPLRTPLPTFIPSDRPDTAFAAAHPGWERFLDGTREFKVFREGGKLMAVQVIDTKGNGIPPSLFTRSMQELTNMRDYRLTSREVKDNHLIKRGKLGGDGSVIIYKNPADTVLHAFVIHFDQERNPR